MHPPPSTCLEPPRHSEHFSTHRPEKEGLQTLNHPNGNDVYRGGKRAFPRIGFPFLAAHFCLLLIAEA